jgi:drug/metabolite transporter (DMT)-like permease
MSVEREADDAAPPDRRGRGAALAASPYLLLALASLCWSGNHVLGRAIAGHVPPYGVSTVRWLVGAVALWPLARPHLRRDWPAVRGHWRIILFLALSGGALFSALQYVGLQYTTALNVSVLNSLAPMLIVVAGAALFGDRLRALQLAGIATSLAGVLFIVTRGDLRAVTGLRFNAGDLIIFFNMAVLAVYSACLRRLPRVHWLTFLFLLSAISSLGTAPFFAWEHFSGITFQATWLTLFALIYVAIFPSVVAFAAWNRGVDLIGANRAGAFLHLIPLYSALLAGVFLGEPTRPYHVAGFVLILAGVTLAARRGSR